MLNLSEIKDWYKQQLPDVEWIGVGKMDNSREFAICLYNNRPTPNYIAVGGEECTGYQEKKLQLLIRWGKNYTIAEDKANVVYNLSNNIKSSISNNKILIENEHSHPICLGEDNKGVFEFSVDIKIIIEKGA